ncbi:MAG: hypothetical protein ACRENO_08285 [Thermodesulfobacteriota bacterium]
MKKTISLKIIKQILESEIEMFEADFKNKKYGKKAKLLHKHYKKILVLLNIVGIKK